MKPIVISHDPRVFHQPHWAHDSDLDEAIDGAMATLTANAIKQAILAFARHYEELELAGIQFSLELHFGLSSSGAIPRLSATYAYSEHQKSPWPSASILEDAELGDWEKVYAPRFDKLLQSRIAVLSNFIHEGSDKESLALALGQRMLSPEDFNAWAASLEATTLDEATDPVRLADVARARL